MIRFACMSCGQGVWLDTVQMDLPARLAEGEAVKGYCPHCRHPYLRAKEFPSEEPKEEEKKIA